MKFKVIESGEQDVFEQDVNQALSEGWNLHGGTAYSEYFAHWPADGYEESETRFRYVQALIRNDKD